MQAPTNITGVAVQSF